jgi:hypothetical protein
MARGAVYYHPQFKFHDNDIGEKRFVILNEPRGDEPYLVAKTTTNLRERPCLKGCNPSQKVFFVPQGAESALPLNTLIQLFEFYEFSAAELLDASLKDKILEHRGDLTAMTIAQLVNCIRKLKHDIPQEYFLLITRA